jgi:glycylpeptide N-tetradecanoyltransferase
MVVGRSQDPYSMPKGFEWVVMDVNDPVQLQEIYTLLTENYVEDDDNMFRSGLSLSLSGLSDSPPVPPPPL